MYQKKQYLLNSPSGCSLYMSSSIAKLIMSFLYTLPVLCLRICTPSVLPWILPNNTKSVSFGSEDSPLTVRDTFRNKCNVLEQYFSLLIVNVLEKKQIFRHLPGATD